MKLGRRLLITTVASASVSLTALLSGCGAGGTDRPQGTVRIAIAPYVEYQPWLLAHQLGLDKQQGLQFQFVKLAGPTESIQAAARGDVDVASTCHSCDFPLFKSVANLRDWMITDQFKGFILIGRKGQTPTFADLSKKVGADAAKKQILQSMKGKTFTIRKVAYEPLLKAALAQAGLTEADVRIKDFPDDAKAALAYMSGTGDYYMGSLPQESKMLMQHGDQYAEIGGTDILGPAGLWYSTMAATEDWLKKNRDTAQKMLAVWYRTMRYMKERPDTTLRPLTKAINEATAASFSEDQVKFITTKLDAFFTLPEAKNAAYNPQSDLYWKRSADFYAKQNKDLPHNFDLTTYIQDETYFDDLQRNAKLVQWIDSPLPAGGTS